MALVYQKGRHPPEILNRRGLNYLQLTEGTLRTQVKSFGFSFGVGHFNSFKVVNVGLMFVSSMQNGKIGSD